MNENIENTCCVEEETIFLDLSSRVNLDGVELTGNEIKERIIDSIILKERLQELRNNGAFKEVQIDFLNGEESI